MLNAIGRFAIATVGVVGLVGMEIKLRIRGWLRRRHAARKQEGATK